MTGLRRIVFNNLREKYWKQTLPECQFLKSLIIFPKTFNLKAVRQICSCYLVAFPNRTTTTNGNTTSTSTSTTGTSGSLAGTNGVVQLEENQLERLLNEFIERGFLVPVGNNRYEVDTVVKNFLSTDVSFTEQSSAADQGAMSSTTPSAAMTRVVEEVRPRFVDYYSKVMHELNHDNLFKQGWFRERSMGAYDIERDNFEYAQMLMKEGDEKKFREFLCAGLDVMRYCVNGRQRIHVLKSVLSSDEKKKDDGFGEVGLGFGSNSHGHDGLAFGSELGGDHHSGFHGNGMDISDTMTTLSGVHGNSSGTSHDILDNIFKQSNHEAEEANSRYEKQSHGKNGDGIRRQLSFGDLTNCFDNGSTWSSSAALCKEIVKRKARLNLALGEAYFDTLDLEKAEPPLQKAINLMSDHEHELDDNFMSVHGVLATLLLANLKMRLQHWQEARSLLIGGLKLLQKKGMGKTTYAINAMLNLVGVYVAKREFSKAKVLSRQLLDCLIAMGYEDLPIMADARGQTGLVYMSLGEYKQAEEQFSSALEIIAGWSRKKKWKDIPIQHCLELDLWLMEGWAKAIYMQGRHPEAQDIIQKADQDRSARGLPNNYQIVYGEDSSGSAALLSGPCRLSINERVHVRHVY